MQTSASNNNNSSAAAAAADKFVRWAKKHGVYVSPHIAMLVPTASMGCGVFARTAVAEGTTLLSCPAYMSLSPYSGSSSNSGGGGVTAAPAVAVAAAVLDTCAAARRDGVLYVTLLLMAEQCRRRTSPWREWLEVCPECPHHLFALTPLQAAALAVPALAEDGDDDDDDNDDDDKDAGDNDDKSSENEADVSLLSCTAVSTQLREVAAALRWRRARGITRAHPTLWPRAEATRRLFCRCLAHVLSRNFHREELRGREGPYLLPGLDFLNHATAETGGANARLCVRGGGRRHGLTYDVTASRALRRGEQVCLSYGRIGAARYAVEFHFVTGAVARDDLVRVEARTLVALVALAMRSPEQAQHDDKDAAAAAQAAQCVLLDAACVREGGRRVAVLQRCGVLYDEGLLLARPPPLLSSRSRQRASEAAAQSDRENKDDEGDMVVTSEVQSHVWALLTTVYALAVPRATFDADVYPALSRNWQPPRHLPVSNSRGDDKSDGTKVDDAVLLADVAVRVLATKRRAIALQRACVDAAFCDDDAHTVARRALLHAALQSEDDTLRAYMRLLQQQQQE